MDKLRALELLLATAEHGSFISVAHSLGISPSTVSKAITRLEAELGVQLFYRNTRQLSLTEAGSEYVSVTKTTLDELEAVESNLKQYNDTPSGHLKISVPVSYGRLYVRPWMGEFLTHYPDISLELSYNDQYVDMFEQGVDVCVRSGTVQDKRLVCRRLSPIDFVTCASPDYIESHAPEIKDVFRTEMDIDKHRWISFRFSQTGKVLPLMRGAPSALIHYEPQRQLIVDDGEAMAEFCAEGLGLSQMPHFIAKNWLDSGALQMLLPPIRPDSFGVYVLYPKRHYLPLKVRVFIDFIVEKLKVIGEAPYETWATRFR